MGDGLDSVRAVRVRYLFFMCAPIGLIVTTIAVYFNSLWYGFIFDDLPTIVNYVHVRTLDFKGTLFANTRWVSRLLNQITYYYWGASPLPYRVTNLFIHILAGILVFITLIRLFNSATKNNFLHTHAWSIATLASSLFLLHPVQTQTVMYITQMRLEGLVTLFVMIVLTTFVFAVTTQRTFLKLFLYGLSFISAAIAAGTKEIIIVLPLLIMLVDWFFLAQAEWPVMRSRLWMYGVYALIVWGLFLKYGLLTPDMVKVLVTNPLHCNRGNILTTHAHELIDVFSFALSQFKVLMHYIAIFFWPFNLSFDYDVKLVRTVTGADVWAPALGILGFMGMLAVCYRSWKTRILTFGGLWFFIVMLPRTSIVPSTELICDYKTFPASLGMMIILAYSIIYCAVRLVQAWPMVNALLHVRGTLVAVQLVGCLLFAWVSKDRTEIWSSEVIFWKDTLEKSNKARVLNNYATSLLECGDIEPAIEHFNKAIEKDSFYAEPHVNLGTIYQAQNNREQALRHYARAIEIGEGHPELFNNLGALYASGNDDAKAEYCFKQAIELRPYYSKAHFSLGQLYYKQGNLEDAWEHYHQAVLGDMPEPEMYYCLGTVAIDLGAVDEAIESLSALSKDFKNSSFLLGCCYHAKENYEKALNYFAFAYKKDPKNPSYAYNYAQTLLKKKDFAHALPLYEECMKYTQIFPFASQHVAHCREKLGLQHA